MAGIFGYLVGSFGGINDGSLWPNGRHNGVLILRAQSAYWTQNANLKFIVIRIQKKPIYTILHCGVKARRL
jgi:hypothetical protein